MKAFILCAGLGTRLRPLTDKFPKALLPILGKSLLEINIRNLQRFGIFDVVLNVHHFADQIEDVLIREEGFGSRFEISDERECLLDTGGALLHAAKFLQKEEVFLMMNVDVLSDFQLSGLLGQHLATRAIATLAVQQRESSRYLLFDANGQLRGWESTVKNKKLLPGLRKGEEGFQDSLDRRAFSGIQVFKNSIFERIRQTGRFSLIDMYLDLCGSEKILAWDHSEDVFLDVGKHEALASAESFVSQLF